MTETLKVTVIIPHDDDKAMEAYQRAVNLYLKNGSDREIPQGFEILFDDPNWYSTFIAALLYHLRLFPNTHVIDAQGTLRNYQQRKVGATASDSSLGSKQFPTNP